MKHFLNKFLRKLQESAVARNSGWMAIAQGAKICLQAIYFVLLARKLGASEYGEFIGVVSLITIAAPFASLGAGNLLIKHVARDRQSFRNWWGNALFVVSLSFIPLCLLVLGSARYVLPGTIAMSLVFKLAVSDMLASRLVDIAAQAFQSVERLEGTAGVTVLLSVLRASAACFLWTHPSLATADSWGTLYLASTVAAALIAGVAVTVTLGVPRLALAQFRSEVRQGLWFSLSLSSQTIYNDIDKTMLAKLSTLQATGIYSAAYRLIDVSFVPVFSVVSASYPVFFQHGARGGLRDSYGYARRVIKKTGLLGAALSVGLFVFAPLVPKVLGAEYAQSLNAVRWLALLPFIKTIHYFLANALTGADFQGIRTAIQFAVAAANVGVNLWLLPAYGWRGAAYSSLACDAILALSLWFAIVAIERGNVALFNLSRSQRGAS